MNNLDDSERREEIAVIGMAGRFPGAGSIAEFWRNVREGVESISFFSDEELFQAGVSPDALSAPNYVKARGVLDGVEMFDASFFGFIPKEAEIMDPQQRVFLETAWEALENAGYDSEGYQGSIGVYAGAGFSGYLYRFISNPKIMKFVGGYRALIANDKDHLATMTSYKLNLRGPSVSIQTACSTSLVAVHVACQSLLNGECDMALAGGVSINIPQRAGYFYEEGGIESPDGHCRTFDAKAQGTVAASGVGIVVLKRLSDALADGDSIQAVIKASAINNDGSMKVGYTAPSVDGQAEVIAEAIEMAGIDAESISYIEAHGTATPLGDPIEMAALTKVFHSLARKNGASGKKACAIGSVKTNIGHADTAAGVAGLIKTTLALKHKQIPPSLHFEKPNPEIDFSGGPFYVNTERREWDCQFPRRAGVSSFGIGGANAHAILEESPAQEESGPSRPFQLLLLSAKTETALEAMTGNLAEYLKRPGEEKLADVAYTLQVGRRSFSHRRMLVHNDRESAVRALEDVDSWNACTERYDGAHMPVVFVFPGQGAQRVNMGGDLYRNEKVYRESVDACCALLKPHLGLDLRNIIYPDEGQGEQALAAAREKLNQTSITQPALFVVEYALARLWMQWGVQPAAMIGHSIGEYVAACIAEVFSLEDALHLIAARGRMIQALPGGKMLAVGLQEKELEPLLGEEISLAAVNAPALCVVSGDREPITALESHLKESGVFCRGLETSHAFHSHRMEPVLGRFTAELKKLKLRPPKIKFISNVSGQWIKPEEATSADYWAFHMRKTVRFSAGLEEIAKSGRQAFLEVGPEGGLQRMASQHSPKVYSSLSDGDREPSEMKHLLGVLGRLWLAGVEINWEMFSTHEKRRRLPLPTYPFERRRYWVEPQQAGRFVQPPASYPSISELAVSVDRPIAISSDQLPPDDGASYTLEMVMQRQLDLISEQLEMLRSEGIE